MLSKVAQIIRNETFNNEIKFSGILNEYESRHNIPLTSNLMPMILYGKEINSDVAETNECNIIARLCKEKAKRPK